MKLWVLTALAGRLGEAHHLEARDLRWASEDAVARDRQLSEAQAAVLLAAGDDDARGPTFDAEPWARLDGTWTPVVTVLCHACGTRQTHDRLPPLATHKAPDGRLVCELCAKRLSHANPPSKRP